MLRDVTAPDAVRIACEVTGSGPTLVLVHGAGSARWGFSLLRPHLEEDFTVAAIDRRGRGNSSDSRGYSLGREFHDVAAVVENAGEGTVLMGHSYGGLVAAGAAAFLPGLPKLVLYEPPMGGVLAGAEQLDRWEALIDEGERELVLREFLADVGGYSEAELEQLAATPIWALRIEVVHTVLRELRAEAEWTLDREALAALDVPVLMLVGTESPDWARRSTEAYAAALPRVSVHTLEGQGHGATMSAPELVAAELSAFLAASVG